MKSPRRELIELLERLPDDAPMDTLLAEMHFKAAVLRGLEESERGQGVPHEEMRARLARWLESSGRTRLSEP